MIGNLSDEEIDEVLTGNYFGHLGCNDGFNTFVYPVNYVYDGRYIICHSPEGTKVQVMRENKRVCLQVNAIGNVNQWKSVMVMGIYNELENERDRYRAMELLNGHNLHLKLYLKPTEKRQMPETNSRAKQPYLKGNKRPAIYRIIIDEKSGRYDDGLE